MRRRVLSDLLVVPLLALVSDIRATTTLRKEGGRWKVIGHHTDTLASLQKK